MTDDVANKIDVLVVGAGPTGLTVAVALLSRGRQVLIVDDQAEGDNTSRAAVVYPQTLEVLNPYGVAERLVSQGIQTAKFTIRDRDRVLMPVEFDKLPSAFPYALLVSQAVTEASLLERLKELGGKVLRPWRLTRLDQDTSGVTATFADGARIRAAFVVGADGAHSTVRDQARIEFSGTESGASYSLADVHLMGGLPDDELIVYFSPAGHLVVLPLPGGIHRIVANVAAAPVQPDITFLQQLLDTRGPQTERAVIRDILWGSRFLTSHAVAASYHAGRVALAGDAAHVHSPLGGQGMNLGINDAVVLGSTLSQILEGASTSLLEAYSASQRPVARQVISITDLLTRVATMKTYLRHVRNLTLTTLSALIRRRLAWRLSLLYLRERENSRGAH
jgi:2-polyprenyl-6-methoxyphenol hydroxylase-like FAD-dependent oxidoreductase